MRTRLPLLVLTAAFLLSPSTSHATIFTFEATLNGATEVPPNASPGTGFATVTFDDVLNTMRVQVTFSDLLGLTTASHIHCCTAVPDAGNAGVATTTPTFTSFPTGVMAGTYDHTFDMTLASSYNPAFVALHGTVAGAEAFLLAGMLADESYLNIHSSFAPGGEIRGFLHEVPEPASLLLLGTGLSAAALRARKRRG